MAEKEYIEREPLISDLELLAKYENEERQQGILGVCETIRNRKTADVVEVRHGEWDWYPNRMDRQELLCTNCGESAPYNEDGERVRTPYCPNCGAEMYGKGEEVNE